MSKMLENELNKVGTVIKPVSNDKKPTKESQKRLDNEISSKSVIAIIGNTKRTNVTIIEMINQGLTIDVPEEKPINKISFIDVNKKGE